MDGELPFVPESSPKISVATLGLQFIL